MLYDEDGVLLPVKTAKSIRCGCGECDRIASWETEPVSGGKPVPMCGWHVLYGGSKWGHDRRGEIALIGNAAKTQAEVHGNETSHVPILDVRGRFNDCSDADKFLMGVKFTTNLMKGTLGRLTRSVAT
jgi:hypothetical protein